MTSAKQTRREFSLRSAQALSTAGLLGTLAATTGAQDQPPKSAKKFRLWATSDAHVGSDLRHHKRESLADAIRQSERGGDQGGAAF